MRRATDHQDGVEGLAGHLRVLHAAKQHMDLQCDSGHHLLHASFAVVDDCEVGRVKAAGLQDDVLGRDICTAIRRAIRGSGS